MEFSTVVVFMLAGCKRCIGGAIALVDGLIAVLKLLFSKIGVGCL